MHFTSESFWFRIVSIRIAVLPVERSPMISSRWPRPMFVIESIDLMPVWSGSFTPWRSMTPGALNSSGRNSSVSIGPPPPSGLPGGADLVRLDRPAAVERIAERVDDPAEERLADRHRSDATRPADGLTLLH